MQRSRLHGCAMTMTSHQHPKDRNPGLAHPSHASTHRWRGRTRKDPARCSPLTGRRAYRAHACAIGARAPIAFSAYSSVRFDRVGQLPCRRYRRPCVAHGRCAAAGHGEPQDTNNRYKSCSCAASCAQWARERDVGRPRAAPAWCSGSALPPGAAHAVAAAVCASAWLHACGSWQDVGTIAPVWGSQHAPCGTCDSRHTANATRDARIRPIIRVYEYDCSP